MTLVVMKLDTMMIRMVLVMIKRRMMMIDDDDGHDSDGFRC